MLIVIEPAKQLSVLELICNRIDVHQVCPRMAKVASFPGPSEREEIS